MSMLRAELSLWYLPGKILWTVVACGFSGIFFLLLSLSQSAADNSTKYKQRNCFEKDQTKNKTDTTTDYSCCTIPLNSRQLP